MTIASLTSTPATSTAASKGAASPTTTPGIQSTPQTPAVRESADLQSALAVLRQSAAARQDGLAVLMANLMQVSGKLPPPLQAALDQLIALHLPTDDAPDAVTLKSAVQNSGLFTEAKLASGASRPEITADVKAVLLRLNQAAERWLARAQASPTTGIPVGDPKPRAPEPRTGASAPKTAPTSATRAVAALPNTGAASRTAGTMKSDTLAQNARLAGEAALASAIARPVADKVAAPTAAALVQPHSPAPTSDGGTPSERPAIEPELKNALLQLGKAVAIWIAEAEVSNAEPAQQATTATPVQTGSTTPDSAASPRQEQPAKTAQTPTFVARPTQQPSSAGLQTDNSAKQPTPSSTVPSTGAMPNEPLPAKPGVAPPSFTKADDTIAPAPDALRPAMLSVRQLALAMLSSPRADIPPDLKAVLSVLNKTADTWLSNAAPPAVQQPTMTKPAMPRAEDRAALQGAMPQTAPLPIAASATAALPNDLKTVLLLLNKVAENWFADDAPPQSTPSDPRSSTPSVPPPVPGAPGKAQPAALPTLPDNADAILTAGKLVSGSDAALARQTLLQIASLPDAAPQARGPEARWMLDIPLMTPQGPAVAQLIIERDGSNASAETPQPVWRVQFAIDIEPLGPVRANLAMSGQRTWVTITADRPGSLEKLRSGASWLSDALQATELNADIAFQSGAAPDRKTGGRRLVDNAL